MDYFKNHCWCSDSNWGGNYDCSIIVALKAYEDNYIDDWNNLTIRIPIKKTVVFGDYPDIEIDTFTVGLKPEVLEWLHTNILDFKGNKGWCVGSLEYNSDVSSTYSVFFQRRRDAMKFIKQWSKYKKPLMYVQYFTDIRKQLDLNTNQYIEM